MTDVPVVRVSTHDYRAEIAGGPALPRIAGAPWIDGTTRVLCAGRRWVGELLDVPAASGALVTGGQMA
jgi:hypothetical protein